MTQITDIACNLCAKRDGCMPYNDTQLIDGVDGGHSVPLVGQCGYYKAGSGETKNIALKNLADFNDYAKDLVKNFNQ